MTNSTNLSKKTNVFNESTNLRGEKISTVQILSKTSDWFVVHDAEQKAIA